MKKLFIFFVFLFAVFAAFYYYVATQIGKLWRNITWNYEVQDIDLSTISMQDLSNYGRTDVDIILKTTVSNISNLKAYIKSLDVILFHNGKAIGRIKDKDIVLLPKTQSILQIHMSVLISPEILGTIAQLIKSGQIEVHYAANLQMYGISIKQKDIFKYEQ